MREAARAATLLLAWLLWQPAGAGAQQITPAGSPQFRTAGAAAGRQAAREVTVRNQFAAGALGGATAGFFGAHASWQKDSGPWEAAAGAGVATVLVSFVRAASGGEQAESFRTQLAGYPPDFVDGFVEGYRGELQSRRANGVMLGALLGLAAGVALILGTIPAT